MEYNSTIDLYGEVQEDIRFIIASDVRMKIILCLDDGSKNLKLLTQKIGFSPSTISHENRKLEEKRIIFKKGRFFHLSPIGKIILIKLINLLKSKSLINNNQEFFLNHNIDCIPDNFLYEIESLYGSCVLESTAKNIFYPQKSLYEFLRNSIKIKGVYPIFFPNQLNLFKQLLKNDVEIQLILTDEILDHLIDTIGRNSLKKALSEQNLILWRTEEDLKINLVLSENFLSLALFFKNGSYDSSSILICEQISAIEWGDKLFNHYLKSAEKIVLE